MRHYYTIEQICTCAREWIIPKVEYLAYWIMHKGTKLMSDKVQSILWIECPKYCKDIRKFIGLVNFCRDMQKNRSYLLSPLAALTSKKKYQKQSDKCEKTFEGIKAIIAHDIMLLCPCFSKECVIYTNVSDVQLGGVITQDNNPQHSLAANYPRQREVTQ